MGQSLDLTMRRVQAFRGILKELWDDIERRHLPFAEYMKMRSKLLASPDHKSLPVWAKEHLCGYDTACYDMVWDKMEFSYILNGKRVLVKSPEWNDAAGQLFDLEQAGDFDPDSGKHVWRDAPDKIWS